MDTHELYKKAVFLAFIIAVPLIPIMVILTSYQFIAFDVGIYETLFEKNMVQVENRIDKAEAIISYLKGSGEGLNVAFNERELSHMKDVRDVMSLVDTVYMFLLVLLVMCVGLLAHGYFHEALLLKHTLFLAGGLLLVVPIIILVLPFDVIFDLFHMPLFESGSWLFEPSDLLIQLFPLGFFQDMAIRIFGAGMITGVLLLIGGYFLE